MKPYFTNTSTLFVLLAFVVSSSALAHSTAATTATTATTTGELRRQLQDDDEGGRVLGQLALFEEALATWTNGGGVVPNQLLDYNFAYRRSGETFPQFQITVRETRLLGIDTIYGQPPDRDLFTMDQLFGFIFETLKAGDPTVTYDSTYGYPTSWKNIQHPDGSVLDGTMDSFTFFSALRKQFNQSKAIWDAQDINNYDCTIQLIGFLPPPYTTPKHAEVRNGSITALYEEDTGEMVDISMFNLPTVDQAFTRIESGLTDFSANVDVTFDAMLGYPMEYTLTDSLFVADGNPTYRFYNLVVVEDNNNGTEGGMNNGTVIVPDDSEKLWNAAKTKWKSMGLSDYRFGIVKECRCVFTDPIAIQVSDGEVTQMNNRFGEQVYENTTFYSLTIDDIFDLIKTGMDGNYSTVDVEYDEAYGYPKKVVLDPRAVTADDEYTLTIDYLAPITEWQNELEAGQLLWTEQTLQTYNFTYQRFCECPDDVQRVKLVQVVDGEVFAIDDNSPVITTQRSSSLSLDEVPTLDGLFTIIQDAINGNTFRVEVEYDPEYGYPTSVFIDYDEMLVDEEFAVIAKLEETNGGGGTIGTNVLLWTTAYTKWESMGLSNYHFGIVKECRCVFRDPIAIQVSNGEVIRMNNRFGEQVYQNTTFYSLTIDDIFDLILTGMEGNYSTVDVEYDEEYGYPKKVILDPSAMTADDEYSLTIDYLAPTARWQHELEAAKRVWVNRGLKTYNYTYQRFCECPDDVQRVKLVQVVDGEVVAIDDNSPVTSTQRSSSLSLDAAPTLDGLFAVIQDGINANAFRVAVEYDPAYGYPTSVFIDYDEMLVDEEFSVIAKLEEANDSGGSVVVPDSFSSATQTSITIGRFGLVSLLLSIILW